MQLRTGLAGLPEPRETARPPELRLELPSLRQYRLRPPNAKKIVGTRTFKNALDAQVRTFKSKLCRAKLEPTPADFSYKSDDLRVSFPKPLVGASGFPY
jgi:hypothetical protein